MRNYSWLIPFLSCPHLRLHWQLINLDIFHLTTIYYICKKSRLFLVVSLLVSEKLTEKECVGEVFKVRSGQWEHSLKFQGFRGDLGKL